MTNEEIRIAIAEACGWEWIKSLNSPMRRWKPPKGIADEKYYSWYSEDRKFTDALTTVPNYPNDLNAMHEAEKILDQMQGRRFLPILMNIMGGIEHNTQFDLFRATAAQRAEAFLRTIGKWKA